ncbi:MAG: hypothetical protein ACYDIC_07565 [Desulfobaccales bacterium]
MPHTFLFQPLDTSLYFDHQGLVQVDLPIPSLQMTKASLLGGSATLYWQFRASRFKQDLAKASHKTHA